MLDVTAAGWALTLGVLGALFGWDLVRIARQPHSVSFKEAVFWSLFYIAVALTFSVAFGLLAGWGFAGQYLAGYIVEKSLSVDNLFVFLIIMSTFAVPQVQQARALTTGIGLALVLRAMFIAAGAALLDAFSVTFVVFGGALIITGIQLFRHRNEDPSIEDNMLVTGARGLLPLTNQYDGARIITRAGRRRVLTPMFLVLLAIGSTDVLFALDSIPAVFGVTQHAYIVFVANAFALLGLRPLFFLVSGLLDRLVYLSAALALILVFIGVKLILHFVHLQEPSVPEVSTGVSLAVIVVLLACAAAASLIKARRDPTARAHAGRLREPRRDEHAREPS